MRIPKSFMLSGHTIRVFLEKVDDDELGYFLGSEHKIGLDEGAEGPRLGEAFWHEVFEAINDFYELDLPHPKIQLLGMAIYQVLTSAKFEGTKFTWNFEKYSVWEFMQHEIEEIKRLESEEEKKEG